VEVRIKPEDLEEFIRARTGIECLAHNCVKEFACLKAITVDDVLNAADSLLGKIEALSLEK